MIQLSTEPIHIIATVEGKQNPHSSCVELDVQLWDIGHFPSQYTLHYVDRFMKTYSLIIYKHAWLPLHSNLQTCMVTFTFQFTNMHGYLYIPIYKPAWLPLHSNLQNHDHLQIVATATA